MAIDPQWLLNTAIKRVGSQQALEVQLPTAKSEEELIATTDDRYLSLITQRVFRAGMRHSVIDARWPAFEEAFWGFAPEKMVLLNDSHFERLMQNEKLIRHHRKMRSIPVNAQMVLDISREYNGFGRFLAQWPSNDIIALWRTLQRRGVLLGGASAPSFLRMAGKDTFILTKYVVAALIAQGVIDSAPTSQLALQKVQAVFNRLQEESGRSLCQLSAMLALTI